MATTVTAATLTSTITELISLNGHSHGNTITHEVASQGEVSTRIMSCATSSTVLINFAAADSAGTVVGDSLEYFRITNLDDTNFVTLAVHNGAASFYQIKLGAGGSYLLMNNQMAVGDTALSDMLMVKGTANTLVCDIEITTITA